ncbi:tyrosine tRNA ligase [Cenococcum geophilum 1.58]|uniref:Tyrosine tRNA ligase n=1 Tax=Cenococcum geophilum 1.58 TaxID=794803 RepID=A0ACC8EP88_9PEZI|nr:tyrosine tRNA ligase [Cenococcum geophilum 1.58]
MACLDPSQKFALITKNLAEVLNPELIEQVLAERDLKVYWGTAPTGRPHCGYFVPMIKLAELLAADCEVTVLLADIHAFLDSLKSTPELVEHRVKYYQFMISAMLKAIGVSIEKLKFVIGSSFQKTPEYIFDIFRLSSVVSEHDAKRAGAEVVKQSKNAPLSSLMYPLLQILDEEHLQIDVQFGGIDQRKLFTAATEWLPKIGYKRRGHLLNAMVPGLGGGKMSSSDEDSKIDCLDAPNVITKKLRKAIAVPKVVEENGVLLFVEYVLLPAAALSKRPGFSVERDGQDTLVYTNISSMRDDYQNDILTPQILKPAVTKALIQLVAPIQEEFQNSKEWQEVALKAYPPPVKKEKKTKDKGTLHPGKAGGNDEIPLREA